MTDISTAIAIAVLFVGFLLWLQVKAITTND
jgi:hypothetical protein